MIIVLGCPRSGTSLMAATLVAGGVTFPYAVNAPWRVGAGKYPKHESDLTWAYFAHITQGEHWRKGNIWNEQPFQLLMRAMDLPPGETGWKVPHALLYWKEVSDSCPDARYVGVFRSPELVQRHLVDKGYLDADAALAAWNIYAQALIEAHDALGFPLFEFNALYDPRRVQRALGLDVVGCEEFDTTKAVSVGPPFDNPLYQQLKARTWQDGVSVTSSSAA